MSGTTINPYRFGGQVGYRQDAPGRQYVRARHLETAQGRWVSRDPLGFDGDSNAYWYVGNNPATTVDPDGFAPQSPRPECIPPPRRPRLDFAIACSKRPASRISASFTLPAHCNVPYSEDYVNFYLSMHYLNRHGVYTGVEGGVSFKRKYHGWHMFIHSTPGNPDPDDSHAMALQAGDTVNMSLTRQRSGVVKLVVNGVTLNSRIQLTHDGDVRLVNASQYNKQSCPTAHSLAAWHSISVAGGMQARGGQSGGERIVSHHFSSTLRTATLDCDHRQFDTHHKGTRSR